MESSAGVTLRLLILTLVVLGMPLLAVPKVPFLPTHERRPHSLLAARSEPSGGHLRSHSGGEQCLFSLSPPHGDAPPATWEARRNTSFNGVHAPRRDGFPGREMERGSRVELTLSSSLQERLEGLGAQYLMVERLEVSGLYRCVCLVDVPGTAYQRPFEAADLLPERAVQRVLDELEGWRLAVSGWSDSAGN